MTQANEIETTREAKAAAFDRLVATVRVVKARYDDPNNKNWRLPYRLGFAAALGLVVSDAAVFLEIEEHYLAHPEELRQDQDYENTTRTGHSKPWSLQ